MFRRVLILTILATILCATGARADHIRWRSNWNGAQAEARQSGKMLMIDIYTDWCGWCKTLDEQVYPVPTVVNAAQRFVPVRMNAEQEGREIAATYKVTGYPTILFIDSQGQVADRIVGFEDANAFAADLYRIAQGHPQPHPVQPQQQAKTFSEAPLIKTNDPVLLAKDMVRHGRLGEAEMLVEALESAKDNARMGPLYNCLGDSALNHKAAKVAAPWFARTLKYSKDTDLIGYAHLQLARCDLALNKRNDAKAELKTVVDVGGVSPHVLNTAARLLRTIGGK